MSAELRRAALLAVASVAFAATGCCRILDDLGQRAVDRDPGPATPAVELGLAAYPAGTPSARATIHTWRAARLEPSTYRVGYALSAKEADGVDADLQAWARKVSYQPDGKDRFRWRPPPGCSGGMTCVYQAIATRSLPDVQPIAARFRARAQKTNLSAFDLAQMVVTFVQAIPYQVPENEPFGVLPPALVAHERRGDCDSKALLGHMLLHELGIDSVLVGSDAHHHEMLGVALPAPGTRFTWAGRQYAFTEMTAKGSPIGHINPQLLRPNDWKPMPVELPRGGGSPSPAAPSRRKK